MSAWPNRFKAIIDLIVDDLTCTNESKLELRRKWTHAVPRNHAFMNASRSSFTCSGWVAKNP
jgi:hypothetical protein